MKVRVLSDLHLDVNSSFFFELKDKNVFTVLCGDTSGDPAITKKWIKKNVKRGLFISGNHIVYNHEEMPIQDLREKMATGFGESDPVTYLDCLQKSGIFHKKVEDVHFIGTTMYTDFRYVNPEDQKYMSHDPELIRMRNRRNSAMQMNDYRWGYFKDDDGKLAKLTPEYCQDCFEQSFSLVKKEIEKIEGEEKDPKVFMLTHHCPSPQCIASDYTDSSVNSTYVSDLENFIKAHSSIKCWACGHVHSQKSFKIGDCLVVMNPRGYCTYVEDLDFNADLIVDTDTWKVEVPPLTKSQIERRKKRVDAMISRYGWLI